MTADKHFKQLVRVRMAATGETYTAAREHLVAARTEVAFGDPVVVQVHGRHGQTVTFTPDGTRLLSGGQDARIAILDAATGEIEGELTGHGKVVNAVSVTPDGRQVVSVSSDRTVRLWDLRAETATAILEGSRDALVALDLLADGTQALTGGYDGRLRRWDLRAAAWPAWLRQPACVQEIRSKLKRIAAVAHIPESGMIIESGQGPSVYVRTSSGEVVAELDSGSPGVLGLAVAPDGRMLATAGYDGTVTLWSCRDWERIRTIAAGDRVNAVSFSRCGQLLAVAARRGLAIWSHRSETPVAATDLPIDGVYDLAFSLDTRRLAQTGAAVRRSVLAVRPRRDGCRRRGSGWRRTRCR